MTKVTYSYGSPEYYKEHFMDFVADVQADDPKYGDALVEGFLLALEDWKQYHQDQVFEYERVGERVRQALSM
jgi:hypothetical protein